MEASIRVLYVGGACEARATALDRDGITVERADIDTALARADTADCVVCEQRLGPTTGLDLLAELRNDHPDLPLILFPGDGDETLASEAITAGVTEYVPRDSDACDHLAERIRSVTADSGGPENASDGETADGSDADRTPGREQTLADLHAATRELIAAESPTEICEIVVRTAKEVLGQPFTSTFLYDEESGRLEPAASTAETLDEFGSLPSFGPGDSMVWHTYETGDHVHHPDVREAERVYNPETSIRTELQIPMGEFGVLVSSSMEQREFPDHFVDFAQLLVANAEVALERAQQVELLRERERELEQYEQIFETVQDRVCVLDEHCKFLLANDPFLSMVGYERADLLDSHVSTIVDDEDAEWMRRCDDGPSATVETDIVTADGERIPAEIDIATLSASDSELRGSVGVVRDISDRKRVRAELEQERDRLSALFENIPDAVVRTEYRDGDPVVRDVNRAFERMFGADEDDIVGERLNDFLVPPDESAVAERIDERAYRDEQVKEEVRRKTDTGIRNFLLRGVPMELDDNGDDREGYAIYTDITDQKTRERRRRVLNRVLRHNMRNEMNVISGYAELIDADADAELIEAAARAITETASDVADLSNKIREIERTLDRDDENRYPVDLIALVDRAVEPHVDADVDLVTDLPDRLTVKADDGLERAFEHLLDNAVEHNDRAVPSVRVDGRRVGDWVEVEIRDDGPGIPETERAVLTGDREITQLDHGSGLGLWLANWIVTALGGEVQFDDNDPRGSVVTVRLRAAD
jgi:PAS domain S-box-containing protein